jgi:hypothetical protein
MTRSSSACAQTAPTGCAMTAAPTLERRQTILRWAFHTWILELSLLCPGLPLDLQHLYQKEKQQELGKWGSYFCKGKKRKCSHSLHIISWHYLKSTSYVEDTIRSTLFISSNIKERSRTKNGSFSKGNFLPEIMYYWWPSTAGLWRAWPLGSPTSKAASQNWAFFQRSLLIVKRPYHWLPFTPIPIQSLTTWVAKAQVQTWEFFKRSLLTWKNISLMAI